MKRNDQEISQSAHFHYLGPFIHQGRIKDVIHVIEVGWLKWRGLLSFSVIVGYFG